jgi:hypothetical protein
MAPAKLGLPPFLRFLGADSSSSFASTNTYCISSGTSETLPSSGSSTSLAMGLLMLAGGPQLQTPPSSDKSVTSALPSTSGSTRCATKFSTSAPPACRLCADHPRLGLRQRLLRVLRHARPEFIWRCLPLDRRCTQHGQHRLFRCRSAGIELTCARS